MTAVAGSKLDRLPGSAPSPRAPEPDSRRSPLPGPPWLSSPAGTVASWLRWTWAPTVVIALNAVAFFVLRPGVNDLWAARARASAARHGVGLFYWFGWFGGGSTPGNYSVLTPWVSSIISAEALGALSAIAIVVAATVALRGTRHPQAATWVAVVGAAANLWSGRVPFLFGAAFMVVSLIGVRSRRPLVAAVAGVLSVFCSPVTGAFIALTMVATFVPTSMKDHRRISAITMGSVVASMLVVAVVFGNPGPQHFSFWLLSEFLGAMVLGLLARPPEFVRFLLLLSFVVAVLIYLIPNGMGSNLMRWSWFFVPVIIVATTGRKLWMALLLVVPMAAGGVQGTISDLHGATEAVSSVSYYTPLAQQLDRLPDLTNYRLEVVTHGSHTGDDTLLAHAMLARGWETQEDDALNGVLASRALLNDVSYKVWLNNNAVGYVAIPRDSRDTYPEYTLVALHTPGYLTRVWSSKDWVLYRVEHRVPILAAPGSITAHSQSQLTLHIPCTCTLSLRVRFSKYLDASNARPNGRDGVIADDGSGWSTITTRAPGTYYLEGSISGLFR